MSVGATGRLDGDTIIIQLPKDRAHALMVATQACRCVDCKASQSKATEATRKAFVGMLARLTGKKVVT